MSEVQLAGRMRRLLATGVDAVLVPALTMLLIMLTNVMEDAEDYAAPVQIVVSVLALAVISYLLLNGYLLWQRGQTVGKALFGIQIVGHRGGGPTTTPAAFWRLVCVRALFFPLLFVVVVPWWLLVPLIDQLMIFGKSRRCLHDLVSGTSVVKYSPGAP